MLGGYNTLYIYTYTPYGVVSTSSFIARKLYSLYLHPEKLDIPRNRWNGYRRIVVSMLKTYIRESLDNPDNKMFADKVYMLLSRYVGRRVDESVYMAILNPYRFLDEYREITKQKLIVVSPEYRHPMIYTADSIWSRRVGRYGLITSIYGHAYPMPRIYISPHLDKIEYIYLCRTVGQGYIPCYEVSRPRQFISSYILDRLLESTRRKDISRYT